MSRWAEILLEFLKFILLASALYYGKKATVEISQINQIVGDHFASEVSLPSRESVGPIQKAKNKND